LRATRKRASDRLFSTGIESLDLILRGGIPSYAVVIVAGTPGSGKTTLAQQILFANAKFDRKGVYLTTVSESPMKAMRYQSGFAFFDAERFGETVIFRDIAQLIRKDGLVRALDTITDMLREIQPHVVVIDSFRAIHDLAASPQEMRTFIYDLAIEISAMQATTLLLGEYAEDDIAHMPEFAVADGIIWLYSELRDDQQTRFLRVMKMRGVNHLTGAFNFTIRRSGLEIFTLIEETIKPETTRGEPISTGVTQLDSLLRGGIPARAPLLLTGAAGTGKSTLALQYLYSGAAEDDDTGVYFSYEETPEQIIANAERFGWNLRPLIERGKLRIDYVPLPEINANEQALYIRQVSQETGARRVVVDSLTMLLNRIDQPDIIRLLVYQLTTALRNAGSTALIISDPPIGTHTLSRFGVEESIIDGVVVLRIVPSDAGRTRTRTVEVYKMRGVAHASGEHLMKITSQGIQVFPRIEELVR
jgi:circadian clock protein KaiC